MTTHLYLLIPDTWTVDPKGQLGIEVDDQGRPDLYDEDLWQAQKGTWTLDVGATKGYLHSAFLCHVVESANWRSPVEKVWLDTSGEVQAWVNRWVRRLKDENP